jgi:hypothetical protein
MILKRSKHLPRDDLKKAQSSLSTAVDLENLESLWNQVVLDPEILNPSLSVYPEASLFPDAPHKHETYDSSEIPLSAKTIKHITHYEGMRGERTGGPLVGSR